MERDLSGLLSLRYDAEQQALIDDAVRAAQLAPADGFERYAFSDRLVAKGRQLFAVFGCVAREILTMPSVEDAGNAFDYLPVVVSGKVVEQCPEEGRSGLLMLMRCRRAHGRVCDRPLWMTTYVPTGWLWASELELPPDRVMQKIIDEAQRGGRALTGGQCG
ncbi:hypothetical protein CJO80_27145 (plasmid) [Ralstonia solanacearum]|nr:hypothetical protein CJO80_27145 [Ralstonia solanacearum]